MISNFVTLSDYCVLEFMQHPLGDPSPEIISSTFFKLNNSHLELLQVYNDDSDLQKTRNIKDITVTPIGNSRLALLDSDIFPEYQEYDAALTQTSINPSNSANLVFDTVRFHFASGFSFEEVGSVIVGVKHKMNDLKNFIFANVVLDSITAEEILTFNTRPLFLGNAIYDKYIDVKIPSVKYLDESFDQFGPLSFEYQITDGVGFIKNAPLTVFLQEASTQQIFADNGIEYTSYLVAQNFEATVSQTNEFDSLGAVIQEAQDGDYINFFATWNGAFPDDLISILNTRGANQNWIIIHQLQVYEQVGTNYVPSGNLVIYQENNFGEPLSYRPILKNASVAISMSIDYTMRLFNKATSENVIRTGSMTLFNPNKYGKTLAKIELDGGPKSQVVYNKIFQKSFETSAFNVVLGNQNSQIQIRERKVAAPVFFHKSNVMLSSRNSLVESTELGSEVVYGQGKMLLPIDPANNFIRFNIFKQVSTSNAPVPMGLNLNSSFKIAFGKNSKLEFANMKDAAYENLQYGQIAFKISKEQALSILDLADDLFIITVIAEDGTESMIYTGKWRSSTDYQSIIANEKAEVNEIIEAQRNSELIESLTKKVADLESSVALWQRNAATRQIKVGSVMVEPSPSINAISALPVTSAKVENVSQTNVIQSQSIAAKPIPVSQVIKNDTTTKGGIL
jgi:hypothetical protein